MSSENTLDLTQANIIPEFDADQQRRWTVAMKSNVMFPSFVLQFSYNDQEQAEKDYQALLEETAIDMN